MILLCIASISAIADRAPCNDDTYNCQCEQSKYENGMCGGSPGCYNATSEQACLDDGDYWLIPTLAPTSATITPPFTFYTDCSLQTVSTSQSLPQNVSYTQKTPYSQCQNAQPGTDSELLTYTSCDRATPLIGATGTIRRYGGDNCEGNESLYTGTFSLRTTPNTTCNIFEMTITDASTETSSTQTYYTPAGEGKPIIPVVSGCTTSAPTKPRHVVAVTYYKDCSLQTIDTDFHGGIISLQYTQTSPDSLCQRGISVGFSQTVSFASCNATASSGVLTQYEANTGTGDCDGTVSTVGTFSAQVTANGTCVIFTENIPSSGLSQTYYTPASNNFMLLSGACTPAPTTQATPTAQSAASQKQISFLFCLIVPFIYLM